LIDFEEELKKYGLTPETYEAVCKDISDKMDGNNDLDWSEIKDKYAINCAVDTIRKSSSTIFGGQFRTEYFKNKLYTNSEEYSKEKEIDKKLEELRKERIKLQTANIERSRVDRSESRQELYYEHVGKLCNTLPLPEFKPLYIQDENDIEEVNYLVTISDVHYGASFVSENNEYSPAIAAERFKFLAAYLIEFIQKHKVNKLYIASLGDMLQGVIRISDLKINDSSVVKATVEISHLIATLLNEVSEYALIEYYHTSQSNHCQIRPLGTKANEIADEDLEYIIGHYISDLCRNNERIHTHLAEEGKQYIEIDMPGSYEIVAMHGHQIKNVETAIRDLSILKRDFIDYLILGHYHSGKEVSSSEGCCHDCEVLISPSFVGSDPYSDSLMQGSKAAVKIYGFSDIYGHTETYKYILN
jgi:hypothetical protein